MNTNQLIALVNSLLGYNIDPAVFNSLVLVAQRNREAAREWVVLKKQDTSQTQNAGDTFLTMKSLPADFDRHTSKDPLLTVDNLTTPNTVNYYIQIPFEKRYEYKDDPNSFYIDLNNSQFAICGKAASQLTIVQNYLYVPAAVSYDISGGGAASVNWVFPSRFASVLAYDVAAMQRLGIDYDDLNARMGEENAQRAEKIFAAMTMWDARLAKRSVENMDLRGQRPPVFRPGRIDIYE